LIKSGKKVLNGGCLTAGVQAYDLLIIFILELIRHRLYPANLLNSGSDSILIFITKTGIGLLGIELLKCPILI
jgi:hypothetical protein